MSVGCWSVWFCQFCWNRFPQNELNRNVSCGDSDGHQWIDRSNDEKGHKVCSWRQLTVVYCHWKKCCVRLYRVNTWEAITVWWTAYGRLLPPVCPPQCLALQCVFVGFTVKTWPKTVNIELLWFPSSSFFAFLLLYCDKFVYFAVIGTFFFSFLGNHNRSNKVNLIENWRRQEWIDKPNKCHTEQYHQGCLMRFGYGVAWCWWP